MDRDCVDRANDNPMTIIRRVEQCNNPACCHATGTLYLIGIDVFGHWIDITIDGNKISMRVDRDDTRVIADLPHDKAKQVFEIIMSHYAGI